MTLTDKEMLEFAADNGTVVPSDQQIWNDGVRSGMEIAKQESGWRGMDSAPKDGRR